MKINFRLRLFIYFGALFAVFTTGIIIFEQIREKSYKTKILEERLEIYSDIIKSTISTNKEENISSDIKSIKNLLPNNIRITIISLNGDVLFDNSINDYDNLNNHNNRPEILEAKNEGKGSDIRLSNSDNHKYLYFAKKSEDKYIRVALPYNLQLQQFLKPDNISLFFSLFFFCLFLFLINIVTQRFSKTIRQLRDYVSNSDKFVPSQLNFPNDEMGEIGQKIAENYYQLKESKNNLLLEKQKLLQHIQVLEEGICFLSADRKVEFYNGLFLQYLNTIADEASSDAEAILKDKNFEKLQDFFKQKNIQYFEDKINKQGKTFSVRANIFKDESLEIILIDITKQEKTKLLKQEMTGNIAHELRTPITSVRGYLETVLNSNVDDEKKYYFINRAYQQTLVLSEIIQDMSLIAKMEEASDLFVLEKINIDKLLNKIKGDLIVQLNEKQIIMDWQIAKDTIVTGNENLLYSLFKNLSDNAIRYAGENIKINISVYNEDADFYYFSFYDTGKGIEDENCLNRIFERFYRVNEGRTRETGGSGLGLSIVKNSILFHKGTITAKNRKDGGLEFLFTLKK